jgi:hypothetical protein
VYEQGSFRHQNPYKQANFEAVVLQRALLRKVDQLQALIDREMLTDEEFAARGEEIEAAIGEKNSDNQGCVNRDEAHNLR